MVGLEPGFIGKTEELFPGKLAYHEPRLSTLRCDLNIVRPEIAKLGDEILNSSLNDPELGERIYNLHLLADKHDNLVREVHSILPEEIAKDERNKKLYEDQLQAVKEHFNNPISLLRDHDKLTPDEMALKEEKYNKQRQLMVI